MSGTRLLEIADELTRELERLRFSEPVTHVYNPLSYARDAYAEYLHRYARPRAKVILLGMNPGPWGMVQTGIPFGEVSVVRDWLGIEAKINKPPKEHPKRPVLGLECHRSEVSGARLWGWAQKHFRTPERFFSRIFVANYCPLAFLEESGRNRTPNKLPRHERVPLLEACDRALRALVDHLGPSHVIGIGTFAEARAQTALGTCNARIGRISHPSPASPRANAGWDELVTRELQEQGIQARAP